MRKSTFFTMHMVRIKGRPVRVIIPEPLCGAISLASVLSGKTTHVVVKEALEAYGWRTDKMRQQSVARYAVRLIEAAKGKRRLMSV